MLMNMNMKKIILFVLGVTCFLSVSTYAVVFIVVNNGSGYRINNWDWSNYQTNYQGEEYFAITWWSPTTCYGVKYTWAVDLFFSKNSSGAWNSFIARAQAGLIPWLIINNGIGVCDSWQGCLIWQEVWYYDTRYCRGPCGDSNYCVW